MSSVMRPVGDKPPNIYWRRRVVAVVALLIVVVLVVWLIRAVMGMVGGDDPAMASATVTPSTVTTVTATADPSESPGASGSETGSAQNCADDSIGITATSESKVVKIGQPTKVGMLIENTGDQACMLDAGSANLELIVSSGSERVWSSDDCQKDGESRPTEVAPKAKLASEVAWEVARSAEGCSSDVSKLKAGTYQLKARVGELESAPLTLTVES